MRTQQNFSTPRLRCRSPPESGAHTLLVHKAESDAPGGASLLAYGDESVYHDRGLGLRTYILGAVLLNAADLDATRSALRRLHGRELGKMHWHQESTTRRLSLADRLSQFPLSGHLVSVSASETLREERQRRLCLIRLLNDLDGRAPEVLILESRNRTLDRIEIGALRAIFGSAHRRQKIQLQHIPGSQEPLLWLADILCGSLSMAIRGDSRAWDALKHRATHIALDAKGRLLGS